MNDSFSSARKCYISYINGYVDAKTCGKYCGRKKPRGKSYERLWGGHKHETRSRETCVVDFALLWSGWNGHISSSLSPSFPVRTIRGLVWICISLLELLKSLIRVQDGSPCV